MEITIENLERAVSQFYHSNSSFQAEAHQWLTAVQSSCEAWAIVWQLLQPERSNEAQFFGATTLHIKLTRDWSEVPSDQYQELKEKLLQTVILYSSGPKIVLNRICIAIATFVMKISSNFWPNPLKDLLIMFHPSNFPNIPSERIVWISLEIFIVIPEEFNTIILSKNQKMYISQQLQEVFPEVLRLIEDVLEHNHIGEITNQAVKTSISFFQFGVSLLDCVNLSQQIIRNLKIQAENGQIGEHESEALYQMVTHSSSFLVPTFIMNILKNLMPLGPLLDKIPYEMRNYIYRILVGLAETHTNVLLSTIISAKSNEDNEMIKELIQALLECTAGPGQYPIEESHSPLVFTFWYLLQDNLATLPKDSTAKVRPFVEQVYQQVAQILLLKCQYPPDNLNNEFSSNDREAFRCYRQDIADTMVYCYHILRDYLINLMSVSLQQATCWQQVESVYHVAYAIAETLSPNDGTKVVRLLAIAPPQFMNTQVINTLNQSIGAYADWFVDNGNLLEHLIPCLMRSINNQETAMSATMALKEITRECTTSLEPYAENLYKVCQETVEKGKLKPNELVRLIYCMGRLLSVMPYTNMRFHLDFLINVFKNNIQQVISQKDTRTKSSLIIQLRMLASLANSLYTNDNKTKNLEPPTLLVLQNVMPLLIVIVQQWPHDNEISQELCCCLSNGIKSIISDCDSILENVINICITYYTSQPNVPVLELARLLTSIFNTESDLDKIKRLVNTISSVTLELGGNKSVMSEMSDVVQHFNLFWKNIIRKNLMLSTSYGDLTNIFQFGILSIQMEEQRTIRSGTSFLSQFILKSGTNPSLLLVLKENGQNLINVTLKCIAGDSPRNTMEHFCEIILNLNKFCFEDLSKWLNTALSIDGFPNPRATPEIKANISRCILRERIYRNSFQLTKAVAEFSLLCRGIITVEQ